MSTVATQNRPVVLLAEKLAPSAVELLGEDVEIRHVDGTDRPALLKEIADADEVPADIRSGLADMGLFGYAIPQQWGGLGLDLRLVGLRPSVRDAVAWRLGRRDGVRMKPLRSTAVVFAGYGRKR